jgi:hypothetical protein
MQLTMGTQDAAQRHRGGKADLAGTAKNIGRDMGTLGVAHQHHGTIRAIGGIFRDELCQVRDASRLGLDVGAQKSGIVERHDVGPGDRRGHRVSDFADPARPRRFCACAASNYVHPSVPGAVA